MPRNSKFPKKAVCVPARHDVIVLVHSDVIVLVHCDVIVLTFCDVIYDVLMRCSRKFNAL